MKKLINAAILLLVISCLIFNNCCFAEEKPAIEKIEREEQWMIMRVQEPSIQLKQILFYINLYYYKKIDIEKCAEQIIQKGLSGATDRYTRWITKGEIKKSISALEKQLVGIGVKLVEENGEIKVYSVFANSPAERAGILSGDVITAVSPTGKKEDLVPVSGLREGEVFDLLTGEKGAKVLLSISRNGQLLSVEMKREEVKVELVTYKKLERRIGYVKIEMFSESVRDDFKTAVSRLKKSGAKALVIDLRNNPGGLLQSVISVISLFKNDRKPIVYTVNQNNVQTGVAPTKKIGIFKKMKVVVLVNKNTASAAEIMSGWLKEDFGAAVVGEATYGKDCGQSIFFLPDGSMLFLTTFKYLIGEKKVCIGKTGVTPTIEIKNSDSQKDKTDYQMQKALETARKLLVH